MKLGFETIGNATIICYDGVPVLCTDPWISDSAYFGSWTHTHEIPPEQLDSIKACKYIWFSHGHPDHLNPQSVPHFRGKQILLADHVGNRIHQGLVEQGHDVEILPDRRWVNVSDNIKILSIADINQDSILLIDINGRLLMNLNDAGQKHAWNRTIKKIAKKYPKSFLLALSGFGDADMINFYDENGNYILPLAAKKHPPGTGIQRRMESLGATMFIPSSSMHQYQRTDSVWANEYTTKLKDYRVGFNLDRERMLPAFVRYDCMDDSYTEISPRANVVKPKSPEEFGDNWDDPLEKSDVLLTEQYMKSIEHLSTFLDFVNFRVGKKDNVISMTSGKFNRGITFEVPRNSLLACVEYGIFDDILIGNFMKTTLHGKWPESKLYPDFSTYVAKYADNGGVRSVDELEAYFRIYKARAPIDYFFSKIDRYSSSFAGRYIKADSQLYKSAKEMYWWLKRSG